jgi:hypothetical protein
MNEGQIASIIRWRKAPAWTVRIAVHMRATKERILGKLVIVSLYSIMNTDQMIGIEPYIPKMLRTITGNGTAYVAPILPVRVMTTLQIANPKKTIGIVSLAVKPKDMTEETVLASGGASISEHQYAQ